MAHKTLFLDIEGLALVNGGGAGLDVHQSLLKVLLCLRTLTTLMRNVLMIPSICWCLHCSSATAAFVTGTRDVPYFLEYLDAETLVIWVISCEVAIVFALGVGTLTAKDEFFPVTHVELSL